MYDVNSYLNKMRPYLVFHVIELTHPVHQLIDTRIVPFTNGVVCTVAIISSGVEPRKAIAFLQKEIRKESKMGLSTELWHLKKSCKSSHNPQGA